MHKLGLNTTQSLEAHDNSETNVRMDNREVKRVVEKKSREGGNGDENNETL